MQGHPIAKVKMCTRKLHPPLTAGERLPPGRAGTSPFSRLVLGGFPGPPR
jgi:hypothetical protein